MIRILDRMVVRSFFKIFTGFVIGSPLLFVVGDLVDRSDDYFDRGLTMGEILLGLAYKTPQFIFWSFPIAGLIAAVFTIHSMTQHREVLAAKAGGVSFYRLMLPVLVSGALLSGAGYWLSEGVPVAQKRANEILGQIRIDQQFRNDFVFRTEEGGALSARRLTLADRRLQGLVLSFPTDSAGVTTYIEADQAIYSDSVGWTFRSGYVRNVHPDAADQTTVFDSLRTRLFTEVPENLVERVLEEEEMTSAQLERLAANIERSGGDADYIHLEREQRRSLSLATFVIILLGGPLATSSRRGGTAIGIGIALGTTMAYFLLLRLTGAFGETGALSPQISAWLPNAIFFLGGIFLLGRVRT